MDAHRFGYLVRTLSTVNLRRSLLGWLLALLLVGALPALRHDEAGEGGGIHNSGAVTLNDSSVTDNEPNDCVNAAGGTGCP